MKQIEFNKLMKSHDLWVRTVGTHDLEGEQLILNNEILTNILFTGRDFSDVKFINVVLINCYISESTFDNAEFEDCKIVSATIKTTTFSHTSFINTEFVDCKINDSSFPNCIITKCEYSKCKFDNITMTGMIRMTLFEDSVLTKFTGTRLHCDKLTFIETNIPFASCENSVFMNCNFDNINLGATSFKNSRISWSSLIRTNLESCDFSNAHIISSNLAQSNMNYAILNGANLFESKWKDAKIDCVKTDDKTEFFDIQCPLEGEFTGYSNCIDDTIIEFTIPADALRTSGSTHACRTNKVIPTKITDLHGEVLDLNEITTKYKINDLFKLNEVYETNFTNSRWENDGIKFYMNRYHAVLVAEDILKQNNPDYGYEVI